MAVVTGVFHCPPVWACLRFGRAYLVSGMKIIIPIFHYSVYFFYYLSMKHAGWLVGSVGRWLGDWVSGYVGGCVGGSVRRRA